MAVVDLVRRARRKEARESQPATGAAFRLFVPAS